MGSVHNNKFHAGSSNIISMLDYIVGSACGQFLAGDPTLFRRKNGEKLAEERRGKSNLDLGETIVNWPS
jgi:hypothetical protein